MDNVVANVADATAEQLTVNLGNEPLRNAVSDTTKIMKGHQSIASVINRAYLALRFINNALTHSLSKITVELNEKIKQTRQDLSNNAEIASRIQGFSLEACQKLGTAISALDTLL